MSRPAAEAMHSAGGIDYFVIPEGAVTGEQRRAAGGIFPSEWFPNPDNPEAAKLAAEIAERGWVQVEPIGRTLAYAGEVLVGQGSVVNITPQNDGSREPDLSILGLSEGVVHEGWRRQGIGRVVMGLRFEYARGLGAEVVMAASDKPAVRKVLMGDHGFRRDDYKGFYYSEGPYREVSNPTWLVWRRHNRNRLLRLISRPAQLEITSDF